jgi:hypothetical protein
VLNVKRNLLFVVSAVATLSIFSQAQRAEKPQSIKTGACEIISMHPFGKEISFSVCDYDLDDSPEWLDPEANPIPFIVADAIRVSRPELSRYVERPEEWSVSSIRLVRLDQRPRWFYVVEWQPRSGEHIGDGVSIPVLMNGKAVVGKDRRAPKM